MKNQPYLYVAYLLRMWQAEESGRIVWRASLECPRTRRVLFFASLPDLFGFLERGEQTPGSAAPSWEPGDEVV